MASRRIIAQERKFNPETTSNNKSEITKRAYKKTIKLHNVQIIYEEMFALFFFLIRSFIVGKYPIVATTPVPA